MEDKASSEIESYLKAVWIYWLWCAGCGGTAILLAFLMSGGAMIPTQTYWALGCLTVPIASFFAWRDERRSKNKRLAELALTEKVPDIAGTWIRSDGGILTIKQDGDRVTSAFRQGNIDHTSEGVFNHASRKFTIATTRVNNASAARSMTTLSEIWVRLDSDTLAYLSEIHDESGDPDKNRKESGIFRSFKG